MFKQCFYKIYKECLNNFKHKTQTKLNKEYILKTIKQDNITLLLKYLKTWKIKPVDVLSKQCLNKQKVKL